MPSRRREFWRPLLGFDRATATSSRPNIGDASRLSDCAGPRLRGWRGNQARFSAGIGAAKVYVVYDSDADQPLYAAIAAVFADVITAAKVMPLEPDAVRVF